MILDWGIETEIFAKADALLIENPQSSLIIHCHIMPENVQHLKDLFIAIQHLIHRHYSKERHNPVTTIFSIDQRVVAEELQPAFIYMKKMQQGKNKNILGFKIEEIRSIERYIER
jgi:hypothetical protein